VVVTEALRGQFVAIEPHESPADLSTDNVVWYPFAPTIRVLRSINRLSIVVSERFVVDLRQQRRTQRRINTFEGAEESAGFLQISVW
jgi:hypothetical protein